MSVQASEVEEVLSTPWLWEEHRLRPADSGTRLASDTSPTSDWWRPESAIVVSDIDAIYTLSPEHQFTMIRGAGAARALQGVYSGRQWRGTWFATDTPKTPPSAGSRKPPVVVLEIRRATGGLVALPQMVKGAWLRILPWIAYPHFEVLSLKDSEVRMRKWTAVEFAMSSFGGGGDLMELEDTVIWNRRERPYVGAPDPLDWARAGARAGGWAGWWR
jgi:hypothetical protein